jgi:outer membrane protein TolC
MILTDQSEVSFPEISAMRLLTKILVLFLLFMTLRSAAYAQDLLSEEISYTLMHKLIDTAKKYYPKMNAFDHRVNIANSNIKKARQSWYDIFTFSYLYSPNNSSTLVNPSLLNGYQLGVFVNIGALINKPQNIRQAKEQLAIDKLAKDEYMLNIEAEVKIRYFRYVKEITMLKSMTRALVDAEAEMKDVKYRFEKSETSFENYNKVILAYEDRKHSVIETQSAVLIAKASLEELTVKKLEEIQ